MTEEVGASDAGGEVSEAAGEEVAEQATPEVQANPYAGTKHKVKVNNKELEVPYEELLSGFGITRAANEKFEQAAEMRKSVDSFINTLTSGDLSVLEAIGVPDDKINEYAEQRLTKYLEYENLSPADKQRLKAEKERDAYKKQLDEAEQLRQKEQYAALEQRVTNELDSELGSAIKELQESQGLDPTRPIEPWFIARAADLMIADLETGDPNSPRLTAKDAARRAWQQVESTVKNHLTALNTDKLIQLLPPEVRDAIRKADVDEAVSSMRTRIRKRQADPTYSQKKKDDRVSTSDFFKRIENRWS